MSFGGFDDPLPFEGVSEKISNQGRNDFRTYSKGERSGYLSYKPFSLKGVEVDIAGVEKLETLSCVFCDAIADLINKVFHDDLETEMRNKEFGPGEGFPEGMIYYAWDLRNAKVEMSAVDYIQFILNWVEDMLEDKRVFPVDIENAPPTNLERDIIKPMFKRILHVYAILFHYHTENPVYGYDRFIMEECFDQFTYVSLYYGLVDFNSETAKYLQEQIDIPRKSYLRERERDNDL